MNSKLGIGPMSTEIIEAAFRYSQNKSSELMLIASKNQIDWDKGYVNNWDTKSYRFFLNEMKKKYAKSKVYICRDHCGPGFKNDDLKDVYKTIDTDIEAGFDLIHIDFCHFKVEKKEQLSAAKKTIDHIKKISPATLLEVGTDENKGDFLSELSSIEEEMQFFASEYPIHFFVCQTGSLTMELNQRGIFNENFIQKLRPVASKYGLKLKEHNADYLSAEEIRLRRKLIDAVNVAPQFGVIQTSLTLNKCFLYGISADDFLEKAYNSKRWRKWLDNNSSRNKYLCSLIAGHYIFASDEYKKLYEEISKHEDFKETIINDMMKIFDNYLENL